MGFPIQTFPRATQKPCTVLTVRPSSGNRPAWSTAGRKGTIRRSMSAEWLGGYQHMEGDWKAGVRSKKGWRHGDAPTEEKQVTDEMDENEGN